MKANFVMAAAGAVVFAGCAVYTPPTKEETQGVIKSSFMDRGIAKVDRRNQSELQAVCSETRNDPPKDVRARLEKAALAAVKYPTDGKWLGDFKQGERIAQTGVGMQWSDKPGAPAGGNCYACHQLSKAESSFGNIGPSLHKAVASGGVWKTENAGTSWTPVFDGEGSYSIGTVAIDPRNPNVVWLGSGENNGQRSVGYGDGVYRSEDGGKSWKNVGLKSSEHIGRILIHPKDSNTVYVAAQGPLWAPGGDRGLYKTTDAGKTWAAVLTISENTGVTDVVMDPRDPDVLIAAAWQRRRHVFTLIGGGPESGLHKTTDGGKTWTAVLTISENTGVSDVVMDPRDPDVLLASAWQRRRHVFTPHCSAARARISPIFVNRRTGTTSGTSTGTSPHA